MVRPRVEGIKVAVVVAFLLLLVACSGRTNTPNNPYAQYYTGKDGVQTTWDLPSRIYYYDEETSGNEFTFGVDVKNKGASFTRGGVYISGFDPDLLAIEGIDLDPHRRACGISFGHIGFGDLFGSVQCEDFGVAVREGEGITDLHIESLAELINGLTERHDKKWLDGNLDFELDYSGDGDGSFQLNFNNIMNRIDYYQHGRLFIYVLSGIDFRLNGGREFLLAGDTYEFPGGESDYFDYNGKVIGWSPGSDQIEQKLLLTTCYQYTTYADPIVCIDPDPISDTRKVCIPKTRTWSGGNGAPVAITSIEQENTPKKVIFRINVRNIGTGKVYDPGKLAKCSPYYPGRVTREDLNVVYLGDVRIGNVGLRQRGSADGMECYPEVIRLNDKGVGTTTCTYPMQYTQMKSAYETPLVVELWYGYQEYQQRTLTIKRVY